MGKLEKALMTLGALDTRSETASDTVDPRALLAVTMLYLGFLLSVPLGSLATVVWFAVWPVIGGAWLDDGYGRVLRRSLAVLPFIAFIGIFNPLLDHTPAFRIGSAVISEGWVTFISILVRGMLAVQAVVILVDVTGMTGMCRAMRRLGIPAFITTQVLMVYRYLTVLLSEALTMRRAYESRSYGRRRIPLRIWGAMTGQLFIRTVARAERIHAAMMARGFTGEIPSLSDTGRRWRTADTLFVTLLPLLFIFLRFCPPEHLFRFTLPG